MNILYIDTSDNKEITVGLFVDKKKYFSKKKRNFQKAQAVLPLIDKLLQKHKISLHEIQSIKVNPGPGSFTGIRVGVAIANALSYTLQIPVNAKKESVIPTYS